jgi:hypothetical protein
MKRRNEGINISWIFTDLIGDIAEALIEIFFDIKI